MYADDTNITFDSCDVYKINDCVNHDLDRISVWLTANKVTVNVTKTEFLLIGTRQNLSHVKEVPNITINNTQC